MSSPTCSTNATCALSSGNGNAVDQIALGFLLWTFLEFYVTFLGSIVGATVTLILFGRGWGPLPRLWVRSLLYLQERFCPLLPLRLDICTSLERQESAEIRRTEKDDTKEMVLEEVQTAADKCWQTMDDKGFDTVPSAVIEATTSLVTDGMEAILQDYTPHVSDPAPLTHYNFLTPPPRQIATPLVYSLYLTAWVFRMFILLPIRLSLFIIGMLWMIFVALASYFVHYSQRHRLYACVVFARITGASMGLVAQYKDRKYRPRTPGITMANHMTANDIQVIFADVQSALTDCDVKHPVGYSVTGQIHKGALGYIGKAAARIASALLLERTSPEQRKSFQKKVMAAARDPKNDPILLFPEGYCTNNTAVLQFRKAVFEEDVNFYPIALKQDARLGDAFWSEDTFLSYMFRMFTSWATQYEVQYLPTVNRGPNESAAQCAQRVQRLIADAIDRPALPIDGGILRRQNDRMRKRTRIQAETAAKICQFCKLTCQECTLHSCQLPSCKLSSVASVDGIASMVALSLDEAAMVL